MGILFLNGCFDGWVGVLFLNGWGVFGGGWVSIVSEWVFVLFFWWVGVLFLNGFVLVGG